MSECVFCKIAKGEMKAEVVRASNNFIAFRDIKPTAPGHTLVVPKKHYVTLLDISGNLLEEMMTLTKQIVSDLLDKKLGDGFNLVMNNLPAAGQEVAHAHIHIIPRKEEDGLRFVTKV